MQQYDIDMVICDRFVTTSLQLTSKILYKVAKYRFRIPNEKPKDAGMAMKSTMKAK